MTCQIKQLNKKTGVTYVYESQSYWDKDKKQPRNKRVCIGKIDPASGALVPSKRLQAITPARNDATVTASVSVIGTAAVLDSISAKLGLESLLKACFPEHHQQIRTMAYFLVAQGGALSHCQGWCQSHAPDLATSLTSQRISEILKSITFDAKQTFCQKWMQKVLENDYLCYDITSISSYGELNEYIKYGYNRDQEALPQLNLAMILGQKEQLPVYYQQLPGNITDVATLNRQVQTFKSLKLKSISYVLDKGFYSQKNIQELLDNRHKFTLAVPLHNKWVKQAIDEIHGDIHSPNAYLKIDDEVLYVHSRLYPWGQKKHRCYLHLYYNAHAKAAAVDGFNRHLLELKEELESGTLVKAHEKDYQAFFLIKETPKRGAKVSYNTAAIKQHIQHYTGFQAILSNAIKDPAEALRVYRNKDVVEKGFDDLKNQLDMKRLRMHSSQTVNGRLFVQFIALIYMSALRKEMRASNLIERYTVRELLTEMATLSKIKYSGRRGHMLTEITKPQREILQHLNISIESIA